MTKSAILVLLTMLLGYLIGWLVTKAVDAVSTISYRIEHMFDDLGNDDDVLC
jgi:hypothetical protein